MRVALLLALSALVLLSAGRAQKTAEKKKPATGNKATGNVANNAKPTPTQTPAVDIVRVKFNTSRPDVAVNGGYGVFAELENVGSKPIALFSKEVALVVQPEVTVNANCVLTMPGFFPTEYLLKPSPTPTPLPKPESSTLLAPTVSPTPSPTPALTATLSETETSEKGVKIVLQPGERYSVFWDLSKISLSNSECKSKDYSLRTTAFVPGEYAFTIDGKAYLVSDNGEVASIYHTFTDKTVLRVSIPQTWAMLAAVVGAIVAYFVTTLRKGYDLGIMKEPTWRGKLRPFGVLSRDVLSAGLMGAVVTILASRLAETQFPIKVSVNDVWGAGTIGFLAYFLGYKLIDKLVGTMPDDRAKTRAGPKDKEKVETKADESKNVAPQTEPS